MMVVVFSNRNYFKILCGVCVMCVWCVHDVCVVCDLDNYVSNVCHASSRTNLHMFIVSNALLMYKATLALCCGVVT